MSRDFTEYVSSLDERGEPPSVEMFDHLWGALRRALRSEIRRRGLWEKPPAYLGAHGWDTWYSTSPASRSGIGSHSDALEELATDCYEFIFLRRLQGLQAHLEVKEHIEGLVFRNIRNFLHERQKRNDPLGFRVFEATRNVLRRAVKEESLHVVDGDPRIRGNTWLSFDGSGPDADIDRSALAAVAAGWAAHLMPELITARGRANTALIDRFTELIRALELEGHVCFPVEPIVEGLKNEVRSRWVAILDDSLGESAYEEGSGSAEDFLQIVRTVVEPDLVENWDTYDKLVRCVGNKLLVVEAPERTKEYLNRLWNFSTAYATTELGTDRDRLPSRRKIAGELKIPRDRLPELYEQLESFLTHCSSPTKVG